MNDSERLEHHLSAETACTTPAESPAVPPISAAASGPGYNPVQLSSFLQIYLCAAVISNILLLFLDGHTGDIGFWQDWVKQLSENGYKGFNGNYPPIFIHWLYILGNVYAFFDLPVEVNLYLKFLTQIPVIVAHMVLVRIMFRLARTYATDKLHFHAILLLTAFNPALLLIGPVWGQVDILPLIPLLCAIFVSFNPRWRVLSMSLYALALLTKFQMIAFAPVFGIIFLRHPKQHLIGAVLGVVTIGLAFLPHIIVGDFLSAFTLAYINVVGQYGLTTMGAANIWILLAGNATPDHLVLFGFDPESFLGIIFRAKYFGILLFFLVCLFVFVSGIKNILARNNENTLQDQLSETFFYAMTCAAAFFTLLPAMHERYLLPAAIAALVYYAVTPHRIFYVLGLTFVCAFNVVMAHGIKTNYIWPAISYIIVVIMGYNILEAITRDRGQLFINNQLQRIAHIPYLSAWVLVISLSGTFLFLHQKNVIHHPHLDEGRILLSDRRADFARQDFGSLQINKNVSGGPLIMAGKRYATGLGTHANSHIDYTLPPNAARLSFVAGLDDSIESADVIFSVLGDGQLLWESPVIYGAERRLPETYLDVRGVRKLSFKVAALDKNHNDHANWANIVVELEPDHSH